VPTLAEAGFPGVGTTLCAALFAPAATPADVLQTLHNAVTQSLKSQKVIDAYAKQNIRSRPNPSLADAKTWFAGEVARWEKIVKEVKIDVSE
jgi:tripartite-type tricarboxylate transporter receptor subunit TctC